MDTIHLFHTNDITLMPMLFTQHFTVHKASSQGKSHRMKNKYIECGILKGIPYFSPTVLCVCGIISLNIFQSIYCTIYIILRQTICFKWHSLVQIPHQNPQIDLLHVRWAFKLSLQSWLHFCVLAALALSTAIGSFIFSLWVMGACCTLKLHTRNRRATLG